FSMISKTLEGMAAPLFFDLFRFGKNWIYCTMAYGRFQPVRREMFHENFAPLSGNFRMLCIAIQARGGCRGPCC
ncbi:MAG: hypothetical protein II028_07180, partial [Clostridia bacterium]|nr:hypothetical protein [Clostridia bacterium]